LSIWIIMLTLPMWTGAFLASAVSDQYGTGWAFRHWAAEQWKTVGHVPLWNPEMMGGLPFVGALHGDIFYPTAWLRLVLSTTTAMNLGFAVHYVLAGVFVYALLRLFAVSWTGSVVGGLTYQLSGVVASYASPGHDGKLFVTTLFPVALIGLVMAFRKKRHEGFAILALATGLGLISPHHQAFYYMMVASGIFALYLAFGERQGPSLQGRMGLLGGALAAVVVGIGIGAIQIAPFFAYVPFSPRAETYRGFAGAISYSIPWSHVPEFFFSGFVGAVETYWGSNPLKLHSEYLGLAALGLAALGVTTRQRRRLVLWLGGIGLLFLLVALGGSTPFYRVWWEVMPFMKKVRAPGMALYVVSLVVAVFAAFGVERVERGAGRPVSTAWLVSGAVVAALGLVGVLGAVAESVAQGIEMEMGQPATAAVQAAKGGIRRGALGGGLALAGTGLVTWAFVRGKLMAPVLGVLLILVVGGDLWWNARPFWRFSENYEELHEPDPVTEQILSTRQPYRIFDPPLPSVYPGASLMALGIPQLLGHHGNELNRFDELMGGKNVWRNVLSPALWDLYAIEWVVLRSGVTGIDSLPGYTKVLSNQLTSAGTSADLFRRTEPAAYARLVPAAVKVADEGAIPAIARGQVDIDRLILLGEDAPHDPSPVDTIPPAIEARVAIEHWEPGRMRMRIVPKAPQDAYLLVGENWYPDWTAEVDGAEAPVLRGDVSAIVVPVAAGATRVELRFRSQEYRRGKLVTALSVVLLAVGVVLPPVLRRRHRG
jgi:hypothetical protein